MTGIGAVAGVPLALAGGAVGGAGGLVVGGGIIGEMITKKKELKDANFYLQSDYFHSMQIRILIGRAAHDDSFAERLNISAQDAVGFISIAGRTAKFTVATTNFVKALASGVVRGAGTAGLHIAGIAISAVLIPLDLFQLIKSAIRVHNREKAEIAQGLEDIAKNLREGLISILKDENYDLVELERQDDQGKKHTFLLAVDKSVIDSEVKFNPSLDEVENNYVVVLRGTGYQLDPEQYQEVIELWLKQSSSKCSSTDSGSEYLEISYNEDAAHVFLPDDSIGNVDSNEFEIFNEQDGVIHIQHNPQN